MSMSTAWISRDSYKAEMRMQFAWTPRTITKTHCDLNERMEAHWLERAHACSRPPYTEARGFATDRQGKRGQASISGREKPYGWPSRAFWKYVRLAMRSAFLAEWH